MLSHPRLPNIIFLLHLPTPFFSQHIRCQARSNVEHWRATAMHEKMLSGGPDGANVEYLQVGHITVF